MIAVVRDISNDLVAVIAGDNACNGAASKIDVESKEGQRFGIMGTLPVL